MDFKKAGRLPLTDGCHHYDERGEVPWDIQKYWHQRYSIFSYYDDDIRLTDDAWFGVTPEPVATKIAQDLAKLSPPKKTTLVDIFGGAGGNTIAFALSGRWDRIVAVEKDPATLACAQHNADVYGVGDRIVWVLGDSFDYLAYSLAAGAGAGDSDGDGGDDDGHHGGVVTSNLDGGGDFDPDLRIHPPSTVVFASPPWGGIGYRDHEVFDLALMEPYNLDRLHRACGSMDHALYLPRTSDLRQIAKLAPTPVAAGRTGRKRGENRKIEVVQYCMEGASKAMVAYIPGRQDESNMKID